MTGEKTIPMLPCCSINETVEFYAAMGFEITYRQQPNTYACVKYEDIDLHFFTMKGYDEPKNSYSSCLLLVPDLAALHKVFTSGLRAQYGKVPGAGIPRISKLSSKNWAKQLRFNVIDPGGNWIRFAQKGEPPEVSEPHKEGQSKLARATTAADYLIEGKGDYAQAAQMLDKALTDRAAAPAADQVAALVMRAAIAIGLEDKSAARTLLGEMRSISLTDAERETLIAELERAADLEAGLT